MKIPQMKAIPPPPTDIGKPTSPPEAVLNGVQVQNGPIPTNKAVTSITQNVNSYRTNDDTTLPPPPPPMKVPISSPSAEPSVKKKRKRAGKQFQKRKTFAILYQQLNTQANKEDRLVIQKKIRYLRNNKDIYDDTSLPLLPPPTETSISSPRKNLELAVKKKKQRAGKQFQRKKAFALLYQELNLQTNKADRLAIKRKIKELRNDKDI